MPNVFSCPVAQIHHLNDYVSQIFLQAINPAEFSYEAGQYVNILHPNHVISPLSIACAPHEKQMLEFHLFHPPENHQAQDLLHLAHQKQGWQISGPYGSYKVSCFLILVNLLFSSRAGRVLLLSKR